MTATSSETSRPDRGARLAARELGDVGVQLLRHHRRPGRGVLGQPREAELARRPEHELLADPREVREEHGARVEVVEREVAVGDGVDRVAHLVRRRRDRQRRAGERAGAERRRRRLGGREREPRPVALEHLDPREQVVAERDRLRALQVRVAGHRRAGLRFGAREDRARERDERGVGLGAGVGDVEPECGRDLVVARAAGVDLAADVAELPLDRRVHVLVRWIDRLDRRQPLGHLFELRVVEDPRRVEPLRVEQRALDVVRQQLGVVRVQEVPDLGCEPRPDAAGPEGHSRPPELCEQPARVGDVVDLHGELADPVGGGEGGRAALHAQPLRAVAERVAARVEDRVVVAAPQLDRHLAGDDRGDPALAARRAASAPATSYQRPS